MLEGTIQPGDLVKVSYNKTKDEIEFVKHKEQHKEQSKGKKQEKNKK
jgi:hypothetical protein